MEVSLSRRQEKLNDLTELLSNSFQVHFVQPVNRSTPCNSGRFITEILQLFHISSHIKNWLM